MSDPRETKGNCEWCGIYDHHLINGQCSNCASKVEEINIHEINRTTVLQTLSEHIGKANAIASKSLVEKLIGHEPKASDERRLRDIITNLRNDGYAICGYPGTGYHMAANESELNDTCAFLFKRCLTGLEQIAAMKKVALPDLQGQLRINT